MFEQVCKWNGQQQVQLSNSQIKQIAGRAGRYGLHGEPGGYCTTLHPNDIPILRNALDAVIPPLEHAYLQHSMEYLKSITSNLPPDSTTLTMLEVFTHVSKIRWPYQFSIPNHIHEMSEFIDTRARNLTLLDKSQLMTSPIAWRDARFIDVVTVMLRQYQNEMNVDLRECLGDEIYDKLEKVELQMANNERPRSDQDILMGLETLHKLVVLYMWMHLRSPVAWPDHELASSLKRRTEVALDWSLQSSESRRLQTTSNLTSIRLANQRDKIEYIDSQALRELRHEQKRIHRSDKVINRPQRRWK